LLRASREREHDSGEMTPDLFADFNGIPKGVDKTEFYQHDQNWSNRMILGDSLQVMASLAEREGLRGKVQCIYLDPPYGIKFNSNFQWSTTSRDVKDGNAAHITREPEQVKAFRDTWRDGIHSYLTYLRDRLTVARDLLTESGSIFVQIGDENVHRIRAVMDEVFGDVNCVSVITVQKTGGLSTSSLKNVADFVLWYAKDKEQIKYRRLLRRKELGVGHGSGARYDMVELPNGLRRRLTPAEIIEPEGLPHGSRPYRLVSATSIGANVSTSYPFTFEGKTYRPQPNRCWSTHENGLNTAARAGRIVSTGTTLNRVFFLEDYAAYEYNNVWTDIASPPDKVYVVQTCRLARGPAQGSRGHPRHALLTTHARQYSPGLRLRARAAHHAQVDRQQRRDRRDLGEVAGNAGAAARAAQQGARQAVAGVGDPARGGARVG
jgi:adenine-specific DNA-methyltransferase